MKFEARLEMLNDVDERVYDANDFYLHDGAKCIMDVMMLGVSRYSGESNDGNTFESLLNETFQCLSKAFIGLSKAF